MSLCMAVGSPAHITYSLALTILNRKWDHGELARLGQRLADVKTRYEGIGNRIKAMEYFIAEAQQVPLRASQEQGWFSSLIVSGENHRFWENLKRTLSYTRRKTTLSLVTQIVVAIIAWLLTIISSFIAESGDPSSTSLQISVGSLWLWMVSQCGSKVFNLISWTQIPVIWGWLLVGSQSRRRSIDMALSQNPASRAVNTTPLKAPPNPEMTPVPDNEPLQPIPSLLPSDDNRHLEHVSTSSNVQQGLLIAETGSGLTPWPLRDLGNIHDESLPPSRLFDIRGDERERGPIFNYARIFTYRHLIATFYTAMETTLANIRGQHTVSSAEAWADTNYARHLKGTEAQTASYCGLEGRPIQAYPEWHELNAVWRDMLRAAAVACLLQWGTTGPAIAIAFVTPARGLGCRSSSYVLYGVLATAAWLLLVLSSILSHAAMLRFQRTTQTRLLETRGRTGGQHDGGSNVHMSVLMPSHSSQYQSQQPSPATQTAVDDNEPGAAPPAPDRSRGTIALRAGAVLTRWLGKTLVVLNALWIVTITLVEYTGGFDNCWCRSNVISTHEKGWVVLFKSAGEVFHTVLTPTALGLTCSLLSCAASLAIFALGKG